MTDPVRKPRTLAAALRDLLPAFARTSVRKAYYGVLNSRVTRYGRYLREYEGFALAERRRVFMSIARFAKINRPTGDYYFEFGCHEANTMRMAWDCFDPLLPFTYCGFDSFEGFPVIAEIDRQEIWQQGKCATREDAFRQLVVGHGMPAERLVTVKGFYQDSLTVQLKERLSPKKAAVIYIDCDLYESTVPVLNWVKDFLQRGSVIVFDDWFCFHGDPARGEQRAFREFRQQNPRWEFVEFVATGEAKSFICLGERA